MCSTAGKPSGSTGNEDSGKKKNCFHSRRGWQVVVTHGQGLQPQYGSWGSPCPPKLKPGVTKCSWWLRHKGWWLLLAPRADSSLCSVPRAETASWGFPPSCLPHSQTPFSPAPHLPFPQHQTHPPSPARCPEAPKPTLGDLQSICGGAPQEPQQQLLSAACNYTPGKSLIYGT